VVPPRFKLVPPRFPWAGYGPEIYAVSQLINASTSCFSPLKGHIHPTFEMSDAMEQQNAVFEQFLNETCLCWQKKHRW
jgi:hypothetical protein